MTEAYTEPTISIVDRLIEMYHKDSYLFREATYEYFEDEEKAKKLMELTDNLIINLKQENKKGIQGGIKWRYLTNSSNIVGDENRFCDYVIHTISKVNIEWYNELVKDFEDMVKIFGIEDPKGYKRRKFILGLEISVEM